MADGTPITGIKDSNGVVHKFAGLATAGNKLLVPYATGDKISITDHTPINGFLSSGGKKIIGHVTLPKPLTDITSAKVSDTSGITVRGSNGYIISASQTTGYTVTCEVNKDLNSLSVVIDLTTASTATNNSTVAIGGTWSVTLS